MSIDRLDVAVLVFLLGALLAFVGLWILSPAFALIMAGLATILVGLSYARRAT